MTRPKLRPATIDDYRTLYGSEPPVSLQAIAAELDGETIGIAGIAYERGQLLGFSQMTDKMRQYPIQIMRATHRVMKMIREQEVNVLAVASCDEKNAAYFLEKLGFTYLGERKGQRVYQWRPM